MTTFFVPDKPRAKQRAGENKKTGKRYTPKQTRDYEELVRWLYVFSGGEKIEGAVWIEMYAYFEPPKSISKAERARRLADDAPHTFKPDGDNVTKIIKDALNGVAYKDDAQVAYEATAKFWCEDNPGVRVYIAAWDEVEEDEREWLNRKKRRGTRGAANTERISRQLAGTSGGNGA